MTNIIYVNFQNRTMIHSNHEFLDICKETFTDAEVIDIIHAILDLNFYNTCSKFIRNMVDIYFNYYAHETY